MKMTFGKYTGWNIANIPKAYLIWLWQNVELEEPLLRAVEAALIKHAQRTRELPEAEKPDRIKQVYRELSKVWHPDKGGTNEAMQAINDFYRRLTAGQE